jgi:peptidoglycan/xylan/chitin deacetylase (PgdA/CDA1 family)
MPAGGRWRKWIIGGAVFGVVLHLGVVAAPPAAAAACERGYVALTFDDGPHGTYTPRVLDILRRRDVPATFFVVGSRVAQRPGLVARQAREGHAVANHSYAHANMTGQSDATIRDTIRRTERQITAAGARPTKLVRPPYGATNARVEAAIRSVGYRQMLWTVDSDDWRPGRSAASITNRVLGGLHRHAVVLLHDGVGNSPATIEALPRIIDGARARGFCFGLLDDRGLVVPPTQPEPEVVLLPPLWALKRSVSGGAADVAFIYGAGTDVALLCDWNGDGTRTPGVFRSGAWHLRNRPSGGAAQVSFRYGTAGDVPICGDWNGDGSETVGVIRGSQWHLRNRNSGGAAQVSFSYGRARDVPVVGDWNGDGQTTPGVFRNGDWHLRNHSSGGPAQRSFRYGAPGDLPLVGAWPNHGRSTPGILRERTS